MSEDPAVVLERIKELRANMERAKGATISTHWLDRFDDALSGAKTTYVVDEGSKYKHPLAIKWQVTGKRLTDPNVSERHVNHPRGDVYLRLAQDLEDYYQKFFKTSLGEMLEEVQDCLSYRKSVSDAMLKRWVDTLLTHYCTPASAAPSPELDAVIEKMRYFGSVSNSDSDEMWSVGDSDRKTGAPKRTAITYGDARILVSEYDLTRKSLSAYAKGNSEQSKRLHRIREVMHDPSTPAVVREAIHEIIGGAPPRKHEKDKQCYWCGQEKKHLEIIEKMGELQKLIDASKPPEPPSKEPGEPLVLAWPADTALKICERSLTMVPTVGSHGTRFMSIRVAYRTESHLPWTSMECYLNQSQVNEVFETLKVWLKVQSVGAANLTLADLQRYFGEYITGEYGTPGTEGANENAARELLSYIEQVWDKVLRQNRFVETTNDQVIDYKKAWEEAKAENTGMWADLEDLQNRFNKCTQDNVDRQAQIGELLQEVERLKAEVLTVREELGRERISHGATLTERDKVLDNMRSLSKQLLSLYQQAGGKAG